MVGRHAYPSSGVKRLNLDTPTNYKFKCLRKGHVMKTSTTNSKQNLKEAFALWENKGKKVYYTGKTAGDKPVRLVAFINEIKKNPNQPDINVYEQADKGEEKVQVASLWENKAKSGKTYLGGEDNEKQKLVGFWNERTQDGKYPAIRVYYSDNK